MKNWDITSAKFYSEIMNGIAAFFGVKAEESTEAELHQLLVDAKTLEHVRTQAVEEMQSKMTGFETQLSDLNTRFQALETVNAEQLSTIESQGAQITTLNEAVTKAAADIQTRDKTIVSLSGQVSALKAAKPTEGNDPIEGSIEFPTEGAKAESGSTVSTKDLYKEFGIE